MIHFSENFGERKSFELPPSDKFKEVQPVSNSSVENARDYWDKIFDENLTADDAYELTDDELINEIFDCDENEFQFDIDTSSAELKDLLNKFEKSEWDKLSEQEQKAAVADLSSAISDLLELSEIPNVQYYEADKNNCGFYNAENHSININKNTFDSPKEVANTVAHELRHAYQYERANKGETYTDVLYRYNFLNYVKPLKIGKDYINFNEYENQLVEAEARAFAKLFA